MYLRLIVSDSEGYYQLAAGKAFDISRAIPVASKSRLQPVIPPPMHIWPIQYFCQKSCV